MELGDSSSAGGPYSPGRPGSWAPLPTQTAGPAGSLRGGRAWYRTPSPEKPVRTCGGTSPPGLASPAQPTATFHSPAQVCGPHTRLLFSDPRVVCICCMSVCVLGAPEEGYCRITRVRWESKARGSQGRSHPPFYHPGPPMAPCAGTDGTRPSQHSWSKKNEGKLEGLYPCTLIISL